MLEPLSIEQIGLLHTEQVNTLTTDLDRLSTFDMALRMNQLDIEVPLRVGAEIESIAQAVDMIVNQFSVGGRLVYVGAGTSGRLGCIDAAECPPTFGVPKDHITCIIAGGREAIYSAQENIEDDSEQAGRDLDEFGLRSIDIVLAIASSGRTPYCIGALLHAKSLGAKCISLSCNKNSILSNYANIAIEIDTGAEAIMGSTRLKAGTAQKMVLNMISTMSMVKMGHVYENLMVNVKGYNTKLNNRVLRIFSQATHNDNLNRAKEMLLEADGSLKTAIVMELAHVSKNIAEDALNSTGGFVNKAIEKLTNV